MRLILKTLLCSFMLVAGYAHAQYSWGLETSRTWFDGPYGTNQTLKIATLTPSSGGTGDHLRMLATLNAGELSFENSYVEASFANRNGFTYFYTVHGNAINGCSHIMAYLNTDGTTDIYLQNSGGCFDVGTYSIIENTQEQVYDSPTDIGNATPPGTLVFDSGNPTVYPPQNAIDYFGNMGIGTASPQSELSIVTGNPTSETGEHISNTEAGGYSVLRLGTDNIAPQGGALHQFNSLWPNDPASAAAPLSTSLMAFETGGLILAAENSAGFMRFFTGGQAAGNERMRIDAAGNVGIGTTTPVAKLDVNGDLNVTGAIHFANGTSLSGAPSNSFTGSVGIGTNAPGTWSGISGIGGSNLQIFGNGTNARLIIDSTNNDSAELHLIDGAAAQDHRNHRFYADNAGLALDQPSDNYSASQLNMFWANNGNVGIGTSNPSSALEVSGNITMTQGSTGAYIKFPDGTMQTTAFPGDVCEGVQQGGDYAESVDVTGLKTEFEPGDLIVMDPAAPGHFLRSSAPYSRLVAGIYSTKPGYIGRRQTSDPKTANEIPMAMVGIVPTKVTTENGAIKVGDLLVTSSKAGYAMKGTDPSALMGAVVGKALGPLDSGIGTIEVLVSLQ